MFLSPKFRLLIVILFGFSATSCVSDGCVDFFAITQGVQPLKAITRYLFKQDASEAGIYHWRGKEITLEADPPQEVWLDGELGGMTPFTATVLPQALEIVVPA